MPVYPTTSALRKTSGSVADGSSLALAHNYGASAIVSANFLKDSKFKSLDSFYNVKRTVDKTQFESGNTDYIQGCKLSNGNFVLAYRDVGNSSYGTFVIYSSTGSSVVVPTVFNSAATIYITVTPLYYSEKFAIGYRGPLNRLYYVVYNNDGTVATAAQMMAGATGDAFYVCSCTLFNNTVNEQFVLCMEEGSSVPKFAIINPDGTVDHGLTSVGAGVVDNSIAVASFSDGKFMIAFRNFSDLNKGYFAIYNSDATQYVAGKAFTYTSAMGGTEHSINIAVNSNDEAMIAYRNDSHSDVVQYRMYDIDGDPLTDPQEVNVFNDSISDYINIGYSPDTDNFIYCWKDDSAGDIVKYVVISSDGMKISLPRIEYGDGSTTAEWAALVMLNNGSFVIAYQDTTNSSVGKFSIWRELYFELEQTNTNTVTVYNYTGESQDIYIGAME